MSISKQVINSLRLFVLALVSLPTLIGCLTSSEFPLLTAKLPSDKTIRLMVLPFKDEPRGFESDFALFLRRGLEARLVAQPNVVLCANEEDLSTIVRVQDLFLTGLYEGSPSESPVSQLVNADYAVEGHLKRTSKNTTVQVNLWDLKAGVVLSSVEYQTPAPDSFEIPSAYVRSFPQPYLVWQLDVISEDFTSSLSKEAAPRGLKLFPAVVKPDGKRSTKSEQYVIAQLAERLQSIVPVQANYAGSRATYTDLNALFKELKTPVYSKSKFVILELQSVLRGDYYDCQVSLIDSTTLAPLMRRQFQFENNSSVTAYNAN